MEKSWRYGGYRGHSHRNTMCFMRMLRVYEVSIMTMICSVFGPVCIAIGVVMPTFAGRQDLKSWVRMSTILCHGVRKIEVTSHSPTSYDYGLFIVLSAHCEPSTKVRFDAMNFFKLLQCIPLRRALYHNKPAMKALNSWWFWWK